MSEQGKSYKQKMKDLECISPVIAGMALMILLLFIFGG